MSGAKGFHRKTLELIEQARAILSGYNPMTIRQLFYQLVSSQVIENSENEYKRVSRIMTDARAEGLIPWEWIEDRLRLPRHVNMWGDLRDFGDTILQAYRRDVWATQPRLVEVWLEKDALSAIFEDVLSPYGVTLNVGRGYDSTTSVHNAATRWESDPVMVLYFGDFDPSGEDMVRSLRERLFENGSSPEIEKVSLTRVDIDRYNLPPNMTKATDSRAAKFVKEHGDRCVELDALPPRVLRERLREAVERNMDMSALAECREVEQVERETLERIVRGLAA